MSRRLLLITPFAPARKSRHASALASYGLFSALADRHELVVVHLDGEHAMDPDLAARCVAVHVLPADALSGWSRRAVALGALARGRSVWAYELGIRRLRRRVRSLVNEHQPDVVQVEHGVVGEALAAAGPRAVRIVTIHDPAASLIEYLPLRREGLALAHRLDAWSSMREERRILSLADAAVVFSERDRRLLAERTRTAAPELVAIPLAWEAPRVALDSAGTQPPTLLFVGSLIRPPNVDAALRLAGEILPRVRHELPEVELEIVGESPPPELLALASDAVRVTGAVPDVTPHLRRAAVVVAPIAVGGGARIKVLEALAAGKAVVASSRAAEGISAHPGDELIVIDGDADTAAAIVGLLQDERARRELAARARVWALRELTFSKMADRYEWLYDRIEARRSSSSGEHR